MNAIDERACGKPGCDNFGKPGLNIVGHGWFVTKSGRRRRYRCTVCGGTLSTNTGTAYRGLRCSRREFDQVASLRVEGVSISATARVTGHSRTTIARWLERAATAAACFNHRLLRDFDVIELQADELCTFIGSKRRTLWLFATIEVCSRLWAGSVLGRRSHRNTKAAINDVILRGPLVGCPLIATDGFEYYVGVIVRLLGSACVYGQVLKTRRNNRVVRVERRVKIGTASRLNAALLASEDSETLNTSFIERLNLTMVVAPFAVDQAADLCSCDHENDDSAAGLVCMSWTAPGTRTTATWNAWRAAGAVKMSLQFIGAFTKPACIAGGRVSRQHVNALCGRMTL